jgi:hypothetical protein
MRKIEIRNLIFFFIMEKQTINKIKSSYLTLIILKILNIFFRTYLFNFINHEYIYYILAREILNYQKIYTYKIQWLN